MSMKSAARLLATMLPGCIGMWSGKSYADTPRPPSPSHHLVLSAGAAMLALVALAWARPAQAQAPHCWVGGPSMSFGTVTPGGAVSSTTFDFTCQNYTGEDITYRVCPFVDADGTPPGVAPRYLVRNSDQAAPYLQFDLYTDPSRTDLIGSLDSGHVPIGQSLFIPAGNQVSATMTIHGRIPSGQNVAAANDYVSRNTLLLKYAVRTGTTAPTDGECANSTTTASNHFPITASFANTCAITVATDLEFGNVPDLGQDRTSTARISLLCPMGAAWDVGLDNGVHASGITRNMSGPNGALIEYELHRQPTHDDRWGNDIGVDTVSGFGTNAVQDLTVYGKVPFQTTMPTAGEYSDTVTVTLTF